MNLLGLMAGDIVGTVGTQIAEKVMEKFMPSAKSPKFLDTFKQQTYVEAQRFNIEDLNLSREEEMSLMEMRDYAQKKGLASLEVEIKGQHYTMNTQDMSLIPVLSSSR